MTRLALLIDWPYDLIPRQYMMSVLAGDLRREPDLLVVNSGGPSPDAAANASIKYALDNGADEICGASADQTFPLDFLQRVRAHGKDFITPLTATRQPGHWWLTFQRDADGTLRQQDPTQPLERVFAGGLGCFWCKADVFRRVPMPWFQTTLNAEGTQVVETSDFYFHRKLADHGIEVYVDATMVSDHKLEFPLNAQTLGRTLPARREVIIGGGTV